MALGILAAILIGGDDGGSPGPPPGTEVSFSLPDLSGREVSLDAFREGRPVLVVFWATWCPACNAAIPDLEALWEKGDAGGKFRVLAVDYMESREKVSAFARAKGIRYPVVLDADGRVAKSYGVVGIPTYILIDRGGKAAYTGHILPPDIDELVR